MESIKQQQVANLIKQGLADLFIKQGRDFYSSAFVTITQVRVTPDLLLARVYLSVYNVADKTTVLELIESNNWAIRKGLGSKIRKKVRKIPELAFHLDDTLDEVEKLDKLFNKLKEEKKL